MKSLKIHQQATREGSYLKRIYLKGVANSNTKKKRQMMKMCSLDYQQPSDQTGNDISVQQEDGNTKTERNLENINFELEKYVDRFVVERQSRGSVVGCMLHANACCRQASIMDFRELTPHTIQYESLRLADVATGFNNLNKLIEKGKANRKGHDPAEEFSDCDDNKDNDYKENIAKQRTKRKILRT
ncbi:hypothetical protein EVAR_87738_1 [Eumeta japonica]|uniref:Uncharacterized protein n=1 Tax=Eumeta variegata TaxID=151549 RepID=A0A4C1ZKD8_EUMVA|nr:hypothetical protein EVAR_87738_1 [Eumeta japonica]